LAVAYILFVFEITFFVLVNENLIFTARRKLKNASKAQHSKSIPEPVKYSCVFGLRFFIMLRQRRIPNVRAPSHFRISAVSDRLALDFEN